MTEFKGLVGIDGSAFTQIGEQMSGTSFVCLLDLGLGPLRPSCMPKFEGCEVSPGPVGFSGGCADFLRGSNGGCGS